MTVTVVKTIGTTGTFSTLQLWNDGAPADLTTAEKSAATTFLVAAFAQGEALTFVGSGATGVLLDTDSTGIGTGTYVTYGITTGNPAASDVVTGGTSGATCVLTSGTPIDTGVIWQGQCQNQEFVVAGAALTITGSTDSATAYKWLTTVPGASFRDNANAQTNALRYDATLGAAIRGTAATTTTIASGGSELYTRISNLQITGTGTNGRPLTWVTNNVLEFCILEGVYKLTSSVIGVLGLSNLAVSPNINNCVFIGRVTGMDHLLGTGTAQTSTFTNCTFVASDDHATAPTKVILGAAGGSTALKNCGLFAGDSTKAIYVSSGQVATFTTCYSDISGTTGVTQVTYGNQFQNVNDATLDFRLKSGADMLDTGTTDSTNAPTDIVGTSRPQGSAYDVGCWELVVAAATLMGQACF